MRLALLILITFIAGCSENKFPTLAKEDDKKRISEAQIRKIIENLQKKPEWLFTGDACPSDLMPEVERKIEYKAVGCADNPDKCLEKCQAEDANACYALSLLINEQQGREDDNTQALYLRACKLGIVSGCTNNAATKANWDSIDEKTAKCVADTFEKTCLREDSWGCAMYGMALTLGSGRKQDNDEAIKYLQKACSKFGKDSPACQSAREKLIKKSPKDNFINANNP
jgi:hypothetical protein